MTEKSEHKLREPVNKAVRLQTALLSVIAVVLVGMALRAAHSVAIPLVLAWMIAQSLSPMVRFFAKRKVPNVLATCLALVLLLFIFYWVVIFVSASGVAFLNDVGNYQTQIRGIADGLIEWIRDRFGVAGDEAVDGEIQKQVATLVASVLNFMKLAVGTMAGLLAKMVMIFIIAGFMLLGKPYGDHKISEAFPGETGVRVNRILGSISSQLSRYITMIFFISAATGVLVWISCEIIGVASAPTWGALAFFLNFIPTVGSILAAVPPVVMALIQFPDTLGPAMWTLACVLAINQVLGNIVAPKVMGDRLNLSPVTILLSLLFWGWLWGIAGAFLSVVIACSIKIICENIEPLRPVSVMMGSGKTRKHAAEDDSPPADKKAAEE